MSIPKLSKPGILVLATIGVGLALAAWKTNSLANAQEAAANQPEPMESVASAVAEEREHLRTTTSIGTVVALRSITVRNEIAGHGASRDADAGRRWSKPARCWWASTSRWNRPSCRRWRRSPSWPPRSSSACSAWWSARPRPQMELDAARAQLDVATAQTARTRAVIARKTIRAPFRARVGISDVHEGQYLNEGTELTTLQGVDDAAYVDFTVAQAVAATLRKGVPVGVFADANGKPITGQRPGAGLARRFRHAQYRGSRAHRGCLAGTVARRLGARRSAGGRWRRKSW